MKRLLKPCRTAFLVLCLAAGGFPIADFTWPNTRDQVIPPPSPLKLAFAGASGPIPYKKFGEFKDVGTEKYHYLCDDWKGLSKTSGEGIFPGNDVYKDPRYRELKALGRLNGNHWNFVDTRDAELNFYRWATAAENSGVRQFFTGIMFERLGMLEEAVKSFYATAVHFPKSVSMTYFRTPWYVGPAALDRLEQILRRNPQIHMQYEPGRIQIRTRYDNDFHNDVFAVDPGLLKSAGKAGPKEPVNLSKMAVVKTIGGNKVHLRKYANGHWRLFVDYQPFPVRAITYSVTPVGLSPDRGTWNVSKDWQLIDTNQNGLHDGFFESYVDANENNRREENEPVVGDAELLRQLGVNTLRAYHHIYNKELFRRLHRDYGFYVLCGDLLGGYTVGSGAKWDEGTDYRDPKQQDTMLASVRTMVTELKDEPYILMWVLGNENVYGVGNNSLQYPEAFFDLVNRAAQLVHQLDPSRPVALANGDLLFLDVIQKKCPDIDVMGANVYRGEQGFGRSLFQEVHDYLDKPVLVTEFGAPAYAESYSKEEAEAYQAMYFANNWEDLEAHMAGRGVGNALGGVLFEFIDEWWKANADLPDYVQRQRAEWYKTKSHIYKNLQPQNQDSVPQFGGAFLDGWSYEEWFGITSQGDGRDSPYIRQLRPAYHTMQRMWNK